MIDGIEVKVPFRNGDKLQEVVDETIILASLLGYRVKSMSSLKQCTLMFLLNQVDYYLEFEYNNASYLKAIRLDDGEFNNLSYVRVSPKKKWNDCIGPINTLKDVI